MNIETQTFRIIEENCEMPFDASKAQELLSNYLDSLSYMQTLLDLESFFGCESLQSSLEYELPTITANDIIRKISDLLSSK